MNYTALNYYVMVALLLLVYGLVPGKIRWIALLLGSGVFYWMLAEDPMEYLLFVASIAISWLAGILLIRQKSGKGKQAVLWIGILLSAGPLLLIKALDFAPGAEGERWLSVVAPVGLSFYSLQMIAYLADCYHGKIQPQKNPFKYALFISWFPQILQGPIPRYEQLESQLLEGKRVCFRNVISGIQLIMWGFFLKLMIADKAAILVNAVFDHHRMYGGFTVLLAGIMYSLQLYTDFLSCTTLAQGVSLLFGIQIVDNFDHPYFATSIQDFWRRWHISLSSWLRDYIYIPLGGSRKGSGRKYLNLMATFLISGLWHGEGIKFLVWGLVHGVYQIVGILTRNVRNRIYACLLIPEGSVLWRLGKTAGTCFWVMLAWILFRAKSLKVGVEMIGSIFRYYNPWVLFRLEGDSIYQLGLSFQEWQVLVYSIAVLFIVSYLQQKMCLRDWIQGQHLLVRWSIYLAVIVIIMVYGTYGFGFKAQDFIYGDF